MTFNGTEGGQIPLETGAAMTAQYRLLNPNAIKGHLFGKTTLMQILNQAGCVGIRMYYGIDTSGEKQLVLVGTDSNGNDMTQLVMDLSTPCPKTCSSANVLNS